MTTAFFSRYFGPPEPASVEQTLAARTFRTVALTTMAIASSFLLAMMIAQPESIPRRLNSIGFVNALGLVLLAANRRGATRLASWGLVLGLAGYVAYRAATSGGLHAPATPLFVAFVLMAGLLLGELSGIITAVILVASSLAMAVVEMRGALPAPGLAYTPLTLWMFHAMAIGLTLVLQRLISNALRQALRLAEAELGERREAEQRLRRHQEGLESLVAERTRELTASYEQLKALEKSRDNLVHMVVHDMRSPLTIVRWALTGSPADGNAPGAELTSEIKAAALRCVEELLRMTNDLLDVSKLEEGKLVLSLEPCDLAVLAREEAARFSLVAERTIGVEASDGVEVACDRTIMRRVLQNLVSNGIKHTPRGTALRLVVAAEDARVRVSVFDEGGGVAPEMRESIFEKFAGAAACADGEYHSAGLGLAFCRLAIEAHGGTIGVSDGPRGGSEFWYELPRR